MAALAVVAGICTSFALESALLALVVLVELVNLAYRRATFFVNECVILSAACAIVIKFSGAGLAPHVTFSALVGGFLAVKGRRTLLNAG